MDGAGTMELVRETLQGCQGISKPLIYPNCLASESIQPAGGCVAETAVRAAKRSQGKHRSAGNLFNLT
jgi:hypothetical protein